MITSIIILILIVGVFVWYWYAEVRIKQLDLANKRLEAFFQNASKLIREDDIPEAMREALDAMTKSLEDLAGGKKFAPILLQAFRHHTPTKEAKDQGRVINDYIAKNSQIGELFNDCVSAWIIIMLNDGSLASLIMSQWLGADQFTKRHKTFGGGAVW